MASSRFPGKPLANETGKPLIQHVYERVHAAARVDRILVATDDQRICNAVASFGGEAVMTSPDHPNGTSRIAEAIGDIECDYVLNVQGDEPLIEPAAINAAIDALENDAEASMSTVACPFGENEDAADPNLVKVVRDSVGRAIYFSRSLIPNTQRASGPHAEPLRHIGLYVYRRDFLAVFASLEPTPLESAESLEQLRAIEHGHRIALAIVARAHHGIDTPEQYAAFCAFVAASE